MDKTVNAHSSNGVLTKQSLPLPRTLFSEGGSVVFSELLAESTFRPERFALERGIKKADTLPRAAHRAEPTQNQKDCLDCRQDDQNNILRSADKKHDQDNLARAAQERSLELSKNEQDRLHKKTHTRVVEQRVVEQRQAQEQQYRSEQNDRIARQQQDSFDNGQEAYSSALRSASEGASNERTSERADSRSERTRAVREEGQAAQAQSADTSTETREQSSLATQHGEQDKSQEGEDKSGSKNNDNNNDKSGGGNGGGNGVGNSIDAQNLQRADTEDKSEPRDTAKPLLVATAEDTLENALAGLVDAEGIDVFALQDKHANQAADKSAGTISQSSIAQEEGLLGGADLTRETGRVSDTIVSRKSAGAEGTDTANTISVAQSEGDETLVAGTQGNPVASQDLPAGANTPAASAALATTLSLASDRAASSAENLGATVQDKVQENLQDKAARHLAQAHQLDTRAGTKAELVSQKSSETATSDKAATTPSTNPSTTPATSDGSREASTRATPNENNNVQKNGQPHDLTQRSTQTAAQRSAGSAQQTSGTDATTARPAQASTQANGLAQALSGTGVRSQPATQPATLQQSFAKESTSLPEGIDVRSTQEVRAHRPEGLRLSGQNALDSLRLVGNSATGSTTSGASAEASASSATLANNADAAQAGVVSSSAAAKLAARIAERRESAREGATRERREATSPADKSKTSSTQALLQSLAARLTGARADAAGNPPLAQTLGEARLGQASNAQGSNSQGSNSEASLNNGFSQSLQGNAASTSARASASTFTTASSFVREQVFVNIQRAVEGKLESMTVKLRPELLGRIEIRLDGDAAGRLQIVVLAERGETLDLLQRDARQLEQALQEAGIRTQDQGLQFGLKGQGNAQTQGEAQRQDAAGSTTDAKGDAEAEDGALEEELSSSIVEKLQVRQDGRLNVKI